MTPTPNNPAGYRGPVLCDPASDGPKLATDYRNPWGIVASEPTHRRNKRHHGWPTVAAFLAALVAALGMGGW